MYNRVPSLTRAISSSSLGAPQRDVGPCTWDEREDLTYNSSFTITSIDEIGPYDEDAPELPLHALRRSKSRLLRKKSKASFSSITPSPTSSTVEEEESSSDAITVPYRPTHSRSGSTISINSVTRNWKTLQFRIQVFIYWKKQSLQRRFVPSSPQNQTNNNGLLSPL